MVGKLMGFEFRSSMKYLGAIWAALLVASVLAGLSNRVFLNSVDSEALGNIIGVCVTGLFIILFIAMVVATIFVVVVRFYKGLLGEEGYLMHTLPVKEWQLITSKGLCALIIVVISILVGILSMTLSVAAVGAWKDIADGFKDFLYVIGQEPSSIIVIIEIIILALAGIMANIYHIYVSLAIGQLVNKHRILLSIGAYIGINFIFSMIGGIFVFVIGTNDSLNQLIGNMFINADTFQQVVTSGQPLFIVMLVLVAIQFAIFHIATERILTKQLNLQ